MPRCARSDAEKKQVKKTAEALDFIAIKMSTCLLWHTAHFSPDFASFGPVRVEIAL